MGKTEFERWLDEQEFWHDNTARECIGKAKKVLRENGVTDEAVMIEVFDPIICAMRNEYGE